MKPASAKSKGRRLQQAIAADLQRALALDAADVRANPVSSPGSDISLSTAAAERFPYLVECKNCESLNLWALIAALEQRAGMTTLTPLLVLKRNHARAWACVPWRAFLRLAASHGKAAAAVGHKRMDNEGE